MKRGRTGVDVLMFAALVLGVGGSALTLGGALPAAFLPYVFVLSISALALSFSDAGERGQPTWPAVVLGALGVYTFLTTLSLPIGWLAKLSPVAADVWGRALAPLGRDVTSGSLSVAPILSTFEASKWCSYGATLYIAAKLARRHGAAAVLSVVFLSGTLVALASLGHAVVGAERVFGIYLPVHHLFQGHLGPILNPNNLAGYLVLSALVGLGLILSRRPPFSRWGLGAALIVVLAVCLRTASRGGIAALILGLLVFTLALAFSKRSRFASARVVAYVTSGALAVAGTFAFVGADAAFWSSLLSGNFDKLKLAEWSGPVIRDYSAFGAGRGSFESVFFAYRPATASNVAFTHPENFAVQWITEWGLAVSVIAFSALAYHLRPTRMGFARGAAATGALAGAFALLAHNLVDLGLELGAVGVALACVLGAVHGGAPRRPQRDRRFDVVSQWALRFCLLVGLVAAVSSVARRARTVDGDRRALRQVLEARMRDPSPELRQRLSDEVVRQSLRHPADYYFPLMGAFSAQLDGDNPVPWIQRALERGPTVGRTHVLLGEVLIGRGLRAQGLMELRLGVTHEPTLAVFVGLVAVRNTRDPSELMRVVPEGGAGAPVLVALADALTRPSDVPARLALDREALRRDPGLVASRVRIGDALLQAIESDTPPCAAGPARLACETEIAEHVEALDRAAPQSTASPRLAARLAHARGDAVGALTALETGCVRPGDRANCLRLRAELIVKSKLGDANAALEEFASAACGDRKECAEAHAWVGHIKTKQGLLQQAVSSFERAAREDPSPERWLALADAAERAGEIGTAKAALLEVVKRSSRTPTLDARIRKLEALP